ncbi:MAG TPA: tripartite tricarboxylate transporter substrate binding protein [Xanthobacteraceae bacterium]|jgi:tripartite-type tricarboxylate transporter receptor subunit TctC|nr:tripartite tricarboxylate transporter substrate binding protein [Xanthobacteraceae bacterium]
MRRRDMLTGAIAAFGAVSIPSSTVGGEADYPRQPIRLVVPRSAGGVVDIVARLWAEQVKQRLSNIIVENQGGGGGLIAASTVAHAKPDGYTLLAGTTSELVITPAITPNPPYDPLQDLIPITLMAESVSALMVHSSLPVHSLQELVAYDRAHPGTLVYGSAGVGTAAHLCAELFKQLAGLRDIVHVPYRGANAGLIDFFAGRLPMFAASISPQVLAMHSNGTIRVLVAGTDHRLRAAPDIPIGSDVGFPELITVQFMGLFAPRGTPEPIVQAVAAVSHDILLKPDVQQRLIEDGFEPLTDSGPEKAANFIREELVRWTPVLKASGLSGG